MAHLGQKAWNKDTKYIQITGSKNHKWKGAKVGYSALHSWIHRTYGKADKCNKCGVLNKRYAWANLSGKYLRDIKDWSMLCYSCHKRFDINRLGKIKWNSKSGLNLKYTRNWSKLDYPYI